MTAELDLRGILAPDRLRHPADPGEDASCTQRGGFAPLGALSASRLEDARAFGLRVAVEGWLCGPIDASREIYRAPWAPPAGEVGPD